MRHDAPTEPLLIAGARILDPDHPQGRRVDLLIEEGRISRIEAAGQLGGYEYVDASDRLAIPGLINGHTHSHGALGRGLIPDRISLEAFLAMSGAVNGARDPAAMKTSALLNAAELLRKGCTAAFDMVVELPVPSVEGLLAVGEAYAQAGLRAVVAPMIADRSLYAVYPALLDAIPEDERAAAQASPMDAAGLLAICEQAQRDWPFDRSRVQLGIAPTIPLHCSDALLAGCARLSAQYQVPLQTHLLESRWQAAHGTSPQGESTVQRLERLGCLGPRTSLAHGVWLDDDDLARIARRGATVVHNPSSNLRLGSGIARLRSMIDHGVPVAIGTDASNTSDGQNLFETIRLASYLSRAHEPDWSRWIDADQALALDHQGGARLLGLTGQIGGLVPGQLADLVLIDLDQPHFMPLHHAGRQLALAETGAGVREVFIGGRQVFGGGRLLHVDEAALRVAAQATAQALGHRLGDARRAADRRYRSLAPICCG